MSYQRHNSHDIVTVLCNETLMPLSTACEHSCRRCPYCACAEQTTRGILYRWEQDSTNRVTETWSTVCCRFGVRNRGGCYVAVYIAKGQTGILTRSTYQSMLRMPPGCNDSVAVYIAQHNLPRVRASYEGLRGQVQEQPQCSN
jgi:hypothetical protein